jgi:hypothetical protein
MTETFNGVQIVSARWPDGTYDRSLTPTETAALLRQKLKEHFPSIKCTVKVTHRDYGWIQVTVHSDAIDPELQTFARSFRLQRLIETPDFYEYYVGLVDIDGVPTRIVNSVRSIDVIERWRLGPPAPRQVDPARERIVIQLADFFN